MNLHVTRYIDHVMKHHTPEFAHTILENYVFQYIKDFTEGKNNGENIPEFFGELAFLYSKKEVDVMSVKRFVDGVLDMAFCINKYLAVHISNFMEIVLYYKSELISFYIDKIRRIKECLDIDNASILSSAVVLPVVKNKYSAQEVLSRINYPWRSYFLLANYYLYYNQDTMALNYIIKAVKTCPLELKLEYDERKKYILNRILQ